MQNYKSRLTSYLIPVLSALVCTSAFARENLGNGNSSLVADQRGVLLEAQELRPRERDGGWLERVRDVLEREEYKPSVAHDETGRQKLQAPNRAHNFRTYFDDDGVRVVPRDGSRKWEFFIKMDSTETDRAGKRDRSFPPRRGRPEVKEDAVEYAHGGITEWYKNDKRGLELGFTIENRNEEPSDYITIHCRTNRDYEASVDPTGKALVFTEHGTDVQLHLKGLTAFDDDGRPLSTRFETTDSGFSIVVDTAGAKFPIIIDPWLMANEWGAVGDQGLASFGISVASAGDVDGNGFDDVIIGADKYDSNGRTDCGKVFVYYGSINGLSTSPSWSKEGEKENARFGFSVASAGDVNNDGVADIIIGSPYYTSSTRTQEGRAYVYHGSRPGGLPPPNDPPNWVVDPTNQSYARFGWSAASAGDVNCDGVSDVIIGAPYYDVISGWTTHSLAGMVYVYYGNQTTGLSTTPAWSKTLSTGDTFYGASVASAGNVDGENNNGNSCDDIIVGAYWFNSPSVDEGKVYLYKGSSAGLPSTYVWSNDSDQAYAYMGISVSSAGDVNGDGFDDLIVGADHFDNGETNEGRAFLYLGSSTGLSAAPSWTSEPNSTAAQFGFSVAKAGDVNGDGLGDVIIGAKYLSNNQTQEGRAYVYHGVKYDVPNSKGLTDKPVWKAEANLASAEFGASVAGAGDVNGDGFDDVIIGAPAYDSAASGGRAYLYYGSAFGLPWQTENFNTSSRLGFSVASGDLNGDSYDDLVVGAPTYSGGQSSEGQVVIYKGSATGINNPEPPDTGPGDKAIESDMPGAESGFAVAVANVKGKYATNGAPYNSLITGAPFYNNNDGRVSVYDGQNIFGPALPVPVHLDGASIVGSAGSLFGLSVANVGDVDNDGYEDIVVGAPQMTSEGRRWAGGAYLFYGSYNGISPTNYEKISPTLNEYTFFGWVVAAAGDVNGDGYSDILVGLRPTSHADRAYVFYGTSSGLNTSEPTVLTVVGSETNFGTAVSTAKDINKDGYDDIIVGAPGLGVVYVYYGSLDGISNVPETITAPQGISSFGEAVASAGDINHDGYADILVAAPDSAAGKGAVYLYLGTALGLLDYPEWYAEGTRAGEGFGGAITGIGHLDNDAYGDIAIGSPYWDYSSSQENDGKITVFRSSMISTVDPDSDFDNDGLNDRSEELVYHTQKGDPDSDGDGLNDYEEIFIYGTDPNNRDTDGDGKSDGDEVNIYHTNPLASCEERSFGFNNRVEVTHLLP